MIFGGGLGDDGSDRSGVRSLFPPPPGEEPIAFKDRHADNTVAKNTKNGIKWRPIPKGTMTARQAMCVMIEEAIGNDMPAS
jgi:hypothetical protein